ncbi:LPS export ABC transporter permease LptF [Gammaproteobacteria bacterium 45_16_T64]|nr:LPS export ABC transporter permease LptF [Gammaproteobacteria bacterium 45_16_T64]
MIIYRYLSRQLFWTTIAVSSVLVIILVCGQFVRFLTDVAAGKIGSDVVFLVMAYQMPSMLQLILPLGLFLGVMLCYGRMYLENEMVVLEASGMGPNRLTALTMIPALMMAGLIGFLSFYLSPAGWVESELLTEEQKRKSGLEVLTPGRFHSTKKGDMVTYIESVTNDGDTMETVFIVTQNKDIPGRLSLVRADTARYRGNTDTGAKFLVLENGTRDEGSPGEGDFSRSSFETYEIKINDPGPAKIDEEYDNTATLALWDDDRPGAQAELQWRLSLALLVPIVVLLAVPLSKVNPRQGRYLKLLPSIMIHLVYITLLMSAKNAMEKGKLPAELGIMWVHIPFIILGVLLNNWSTLKLRLRPEAPAIGERS